MLVQQNHANTHGMALELDWNPNLYTCFQFQLEQFDGHNIDPSIQNWKIFDLNIQLHVDNS
jgi:hypothetical protein